MTDPIVIVCVARTRISSLLGDASSIAARELGTVAVMAAVARAGVPACRVMPAADETIPSVPVDRFPGEWVHGTNPEATSAVQISLP